MERQDDALWQRIAPFGVWLAAILILLQTLPALDARSLWYADEVRYADALSNLVERGKWVVLELNGQPYPDKPPLYFLLLAGILKLTGLDVPQTLFLGTGLSGILLMWAMARLGRAMGLTTEASTAGLLTWLAGLGAIAVLHFVRMDMLFVAFMLFGQARLHDHVINVSSPSDAIWGFFFLGLAVLTKGPLGVAIPMAALLATALWVGRGQRLISRPIAIGLLLLIWMVCCWVLAVVSIEGWPFFRDQILGRQVVARTIGDFAHPEPITYYLIVLPIAFLPWTGFLAAVPIRDMLSGFGELNQRRKRQEPTDMLAISAATAFAILSAINGKIAVYILPVICYLNLLLGDALVRNDLRLGRLLAALLLVGLAIALLAYGAAPAADMARLWVLWIAFALLIALAAILVFVRARGLRVIFVGMLGSAIGLTAAIGAAPLFDPYFSPRQIAESLAREAEAGATAMTYATYPGVFSFYVGRDLLEYDDPVELREAVARSGTAVIVSTREAWEDADLEGFEQLGSYNIVVGGGDYLIMKERAP